MGSVVALRRQAPGPRSMTFEDIYEAELPYLWHTLRRLGVGASDREDLAHDVFMVVHRRLCDDDAARRDRCAPDRSASRLAWSLERPVESAAPPWRWRRRSRSGH